MSLIPIKLLCNRRPKSSSGSGSGSGSSSSGSTTTNSVATNDWFYMNTEENAVHCKYPLVGDSEVSAFGYGSSSGSGGGGGSIDPSVLADYVTKSELNAAGYLSSADMSNYVTYSYLDSLDYETAITQLNANMSGLQQQVQTNKNNLTAYNTRITNLESKVDELDGLDGDVSSLRQKMNSYILTYVPMIERLYAYFPILEYMELGRDLNSNGTTYIKFKCPVVSTGDIGAFEIG